jgi:hypothetical protein
VHIGKGDGGCHRFHTVGHAANGGHVFLCQEQPLPIPTSINNISTSANTNASTKVITSRRDMLTLVIKDGDVKLLGSM